MSLPYNTVDKGIILDSSNQLIGTYMLLKDRKAPIVSNMEFHVYDANGTRVAAIFQITEAPPYIIQNSMGERAGIGANEVIPTSLIKMTARALLESSDKPAAELAQDFVSAVNSAAQGTHRPGHGPN